MVLPDLTERAFVVYSPSGRGIFSIVNSLGY